MKMIKWASDIIAGNIREAKRYADEAFRLKDISPMASEWCRDMANMHLHFNDKGHDYVKRLIANYEASGENHELAPGMKAVYQEIHADLMHQTAEIKAMLDLYK